MPHSLLDTTECFGKSKMKRRKTISFIDLSSANASVLNKTQYSAWKKHTDNCEGERSFSMFVTIQNKGKSR